MIHRRCSGIPEIFMINSFEVEQAAREESALTVLCELRQELT
jgi:hypothetical protein